jgi:hypothetical protein
LRDDLDWEMGGATSDHLDKFLQWASKNVQLRGDSEEVFPSIDMNAKDEKSTGKKDDNKEK